MDNMNDSNKLEYRIYETFDSMDLKDELLRGIYSYGFEVPSQIQSIGIKVALEDKDCILQAQSGTGKTGTFSITVLQTIDTRLTDIQAIILSPTRELAKQTNRVVNSLGAYMNVKTFLCIGGTGGSGDSGNVKGSHVLVGTPGRVLDMLRRKQITLNRLRLMIVDEADEMLSFGFKDQIKQVCQYIGKETKIKLFSATMPKDVLDLTQEFMVEPNKILLTKDEISLNGIKQFYILVGNDEEKLLVIFDLYDTFKNLSQTILFCSSKRKVEWLATKLIENKFTVSYIHGEMTQTERDKIMQDYINGNSRILIATDLLARGIDIQQISIVINFDLPRFHENYIHRIGRCGRYGRKGIAINIVTNKENKQVTDLERIYSMKIEPMPATINGLLD
jgi:superfamily II DNA/RNA helicase